MFTVTAQPAGLRTRKFLVASISLGRIYLTRVFIYPQQNVLPVQNLFLCKIDSPKLISSFTRTLSFSNNSFLSLHSLLSHQPQHSSIHQHFFSVHQYHPLLDPVSIYLYFLFTNTRLSSRISSRSILTSTTVSSATSISPYTIISSSNISFLYHHFCLKRFSLSPSSFSSTSLPLSPFTPASHHHLPTIIPSYITITTISPSLVISLLTKNFFLFLHFYLFQ